MIVRSIYLDGFRNYTGAMAEFCDSVNVITGNNAQGKTNLLEAVFYLTCGRSFRTRGDKELIGHGTDFGEIRAFVNSGGRDFGIDVRLTRGRKKQINANGVKLKTASELCGRLTAVLFCPDDLMIIRDGAAVRRRLMDTCICQLKPRYASALSEFNRLYEHKTRILRDWREKPSLLDTLDDFNFRMCQMSAELIYYRNSFARRLSEKAGRIHGEFSGGLEKLEIFYRTVKTLSDLNDKKPAQLFTQLLEHQESHKKAELESGMCLSGAHKDDLEIFINGQPARSFASQGQARTASLSIKLAEREIHFDHRGEYPILLLDDVLSELDSARQNFVLNRIGQGQVLITCCEDGDIAGRTGGKVIGIENGQVF